MKVIKSVDIDAVPEKTWPFLAEPEKILKRYFPLQKFAYAGEQDQEVGASFDFEEKVAGRVMKLKCEVTEWVENKAFSFKMTSGDMMKSYEERWTVEATPSGSRFTFMEQGELPYGFVGKMLGPLAERSSASTIEKMLQKLKTLAEGG
jgi:uncharacterized protein YndB with AHSA1/START domain